MASHPIVDSYVQDLIKNEYIDSNLPASTKFELLCNYLLITKGSSDLDLNDFLCPPSTESIDSIAIKINGDIYSIKAVVNIQEQLSKESKVEIIFIQAKECTSFKQNIISSIILKIKELMNTGELSFLLSKANNFTD